MEQLLLLLDGQHVFGPENVIYPVFDDLGADVDDAHYDFMDFKGRSATLLKMASNSKSLR